MIYTEHHAISDGMTQGILFRELFQLYRSYVINEQCLLPPLPPYVDYVNWLLTQNRVTAKAYWQKKLKLIDEPTRIDLDKCTRTNSSKCNNFQKKLFISKKMLVKSLQSYAKSAQVSLSTIIQTAFAILLARYSREISIIYGLVESGRHIDLSSVADRTGPFLQNFPVALDMHAQLTVRELLSMVQAQVIESSQYSYYPLTEIHQVSSLSKKTPLFHYAMTFVNYNTKHVSLICNDLPEIKVSNFNQDSTMHYPLTAMIISTPDELAFYFSYNGNRFTKKDIIQLYQHWENLLQAMILLPDEIVGNLPMLTKQEEEQQLHKWNDNCLDYPKDKTVIQLFEEQVGKTPNNIALIFEDRQITYQELNQQANRIAHYLIKHEHVRPGVRVAIYLERGVELIIAILAVLKAGAAYVPIDSQSSIKQIYRILDDCEPALIILESLNKEKLDSAHKKILPSKCMSMHDLPTSSSIQRGMNGPLSARPNDFMYIIYTSGSTGKPKGVAVKNQGVINLISEEIRQLQITEKDIILGFASPGFDASVWEMWGAMLTGAALCIAPLCNLLPGDPLCGLLKKNKISLTTLPPSIANSLLQYEKIASLKTIVLEGESCTMSMVKELAKYYTVINAYGTTEATVCSTMQVYDHKKKIFSIGKAISNVQTYVLDNSNSLLPIGVIGELCIGGVGLAMGYLNQEQLTKQKFIKNPFSDDPNAKLYKTGDLARWSQDGTLEYIGRLDEQVKLHGYRIDLKEIEDILLQQAIVADAKVLMQDSKRITGIEKQLIAYLIRSKKDKCTLVNASNKMMDEKSFLYEVLRQELPTYMVPSELIWIDSWPLTSRGKLDKSALPALDGGYCKKGYLPTAPRSLLEAELLDIWKSVLCVEELGVCDDFFMFGGSSLLIVPLFAKIKIHFKVDLPICSLFTASTIEKLAVIIESNKIFEHA